MPELSRVNGKRQIYKQFLSCFGSYIKSNLAHKSEGGGMSHDSPNNQQKTVGKRQLEFRSGGQQQEFVLEYVGSVAKSIFVPT